MKARYQQSIGVMGGMGSFATLDFFHRLLVAFPGEKEWDRPRILIDNRCTMPSRVLAILYGQDRQLVAEMLSESVKNLIRSGADILVLACNTSHVFLPDIIKAVPESEGKFVNIIESLSDALLANSAETGSKTYRLMASEGTLDTRIYHRYLEPYGIQIEAPNKEEYPMFRALIEDVKQDKLSDRTVERFIDAVHAGSNKNVIIGCTEFPPIYRHAASTLEAEGYHIFDPLNTAIDKIKQIIR